MVQTKQVYYRLIALWVVCEAFLGGIIHGLKLPVSGLFVGGSAVICICMIGYFYPQKGSILKATIIVAIFKMMLSPQSPLPAYVAVFFQGVAGELIFLNRKSYRLNCIQFGVIALLESGIQRILVMTIVFGVEIWNAIDKFISGITGDKEITNYSYGIAAGYIVLHIIAGLIIGWFAGKLPSIAQNKESYSPYKFNSKEVLINPEKRPGRKKGNKFYFILWLVLLAIFIHSVIFPELSLLPQSTILKLIVRSAVIILSWVVIINPLLMRLLHRWLEKKKSREAGMINEITLLLPSTQYLVRRSWELSSSEKGFSRLSLFFRIIVFNSLQDE